MFDAPIDAWYVWAGVAVASLAVAGVAADLPTEPPPDAAGTADTIDRVAASPYPATAVHPVSAEAVRFGTGRVALRGEGGVARATLAHGPVVPVGDGKLGAVLDGTPVHWQFNTTDEFEAALDRSRDGAGSWRPVHGRVVVRKVSWRGIDVTLVGT